MCRGALKLLEMCSLMKKFDDDKNSLSIWYTFYSNGNFTTWNVETVKKYKFYFKIPLIQEFSRYFSLHW